MIRFPNCKINLGLHVLGKRSDGYHNIETVFYPVNLCDALEILPLSANSQPQLALSGLPVSGIDTNNLCLKAWHLLHPDFPQLLPVNIHLHKAIPMGAGLGGGSADGALMLQMLNDKFNLGLLPQSLAQYALQLGSDCPFFIYNQPVLATGRGEVMQPLLLSLSGFYWYLINPDIHINTGEAFGQLQYKSHTLSVEETVRQPLQKWRENLVNDFEDGMANKYPVIAQLKMQLYGHGAVYAAMSGSGSTVFGLFEKQPAALPLPKGFFAKIVAA